MFAIKINPDASIAHLKACLIAKKAMLTSRDRLFWRIFFGCSTNFCMIIYFHGCYSMLDFALARQNVCFSTWQSPGGSLYGVTTLICCSAREWQKFVLKNHYMDWNRVHENGLINLVKHSNSLVRRKVHLSCLLPKA